MPRISTYPNAHSFDMVDGFVSLSKGIYTIINLEHASRVKLRDASDRESAINCARYVLDEPVPEVEKWIIELGSGYGHRIKNKFHSVYIIGRQYFPPGSEVVSHSELITWWQIQSHQLPSEVVYIIRPPGSIQNLCWSLEQIDDDTPVCLKEFQNRNSQMWKLIPEVAPDTASTQGITLLPNPSIAWDHVHDQDYFAPHTECDHSGPQPSGGVGNSDYFAPGL